MESVNTYFLVCTKNSDGSYDVGNVIFFLGLTVKLAIVGSVSVIAIFSSNYITSSDTKLSYPILSFLIVFAGSYIITDGFVSVYIIVVRKIIQWDLQKNETKVPDKLLLSQESPADFKHESYKHKDRKPTLQIYPMLPVT